jgi:hypothetical protein
MSGSILVYPPVCINNDLSEEESDDESEEDEIKLCGILPAKKHRGRP